MIRLRKKNASRVKIDFHFSKIKTGFVSNSQFEGACQRTKTEMIEPDQRSWMNFFRRLASASKKVMDNRD